jgi:hypothetical protein
MLSKKVVIGVASAALTAIVVDMAVSTIKGKDLIKAAYIMTKIGRYYQGRGKIVTDEELEEYELLNEKLQSFVESLNGKKSRSFNSEDMRNAHEFYKEVERFYNAHCA